MHAGNTVRSFPALTRLLFVLPRPSRFPCSTYKISTTLKRRRKPDKTLTPFSNRSSMMIPARSFCRRWEKKKKKKNQLLRIGQVPTYVDSILPPSRGERSGSKGGSTNWGEERSTLKLIIDIEERRERHEDRAGREFLSKPIPESRVAAGGKPISHTRAFMPQLRRGIKYTNTRDRIAACLYSTICFSSSFSILWFPPRFVT